MAKDPLTDLLHQLMPFCATLGVRGVINTADEVVIELDWRADLCTAGGVLHGGVIMSLADSAATACAVANLPEGAVGTSTIEGKTNFVGAVTEGTVRARSTPLHAGSTTIVVETDVTNGDRLVAKTIQTQSVLRPRS